MDRVDLVLKIKGLKTYFQTEDGPVKAVDGIGFELNRGETLGIVGESGSGKSMTALSILKLVPFPGRVVDGDILFKGKNLERFSERDMRAIRGKRISMIFQDPLSSLNPLFKIGNQIAEVIVTHESIPKKAALERVLELLKMVGIPSAERRMDSYPHQLSGGMRQRVMIAMAIACKPEIIIADEPTTALDVTIQAQILELIEKLKRESGASVIIITHNLGVIAEIADKVIVMYLGKILEKAEVGHLFRSPAHPYTEGLLKCVPRLDLDVGKGEKIETIKGTIPGPLNRMEGCRFGNRCNEVGKRCQREEPPLIKISENHEVRCWKFL